MTDGSGAVAANPHQSLFDPTLRGAVRERHVVLVSPTNGELGGVLKKGSFIRSESL